jgi:DNA-binding transcriptional regulator YhcF (GntR family)
MTISKAYGFLVEQGLIERRAGIGLFVRMVKKDKKRKAQDALLVSAMDKACMLALELGMGEDEANRLFRKHFKKIKVNHEEK